MHKLSDEELKGLIVEETAVGQDSSVVGLVLTCIKQLKKFAKWDTPPAEDKQDKAETEVLPPAGAQQQSRTDQPTRKSQTFGLNLGYTINLNLPATSDPAGFNAIFRALKEHLLKVSNE